MKRKNFYSVLIAILALLFGAGGGTAWGQLIIDQNFNNVNNDFGAGESVTLLGNNITVPTGLGAISPGTIGKITIGGAGAVNRVLRVYNGNGYGIGWVSVIRMPNGNDGHTAGGYIYQLPNRYVDLPEHPNNYDVKYMSKVSEAPADFVGTSWGYGSLPTAGVEHKGTRAKYQNTLVMSFNSFNSTEFTGKWVSPYVAPCGEQLFENSSTPIPNHTDGSSTVRVWHHGDVRPSPNPPDYMLVYDCYAISAPEQAYTTTQDQTLVNHTPGAHGQMTFRQDEGFSLVQFFGSPMQDAAALAFQKVPLSVPGMKKAQSSTSFTGDWYIDNYTRPTTVAIAQGSTILDTIVFNPIDWKYEVNFVDVKEVSNYNFWTSRHDQSCNSGIFRAYAFEPKWKTSIENGNTHPDAAVQLLNGAQVCVNSGVEDKTGFIDKKSSDDRAAATPNTNVQTNALIVWPKEDRATLRVKGNFKANMHHKLTGTATSALYTTTDFPNPDADIYMYPKAAGTPAHVFANANGGLVKFEHATTKYPSMLPKAEAYASIFGVYGNYLYTGNMAKIHTDINSTTNFNGNNKGVIEVGPFTQGKEYYYVYSGGILKNFESCNLTNNFTMNFGNNFGQSPNFKFTEKDTMFILNYGNNGTNGCDANIHFYEGAPAALNTAFTTASDDGAMQIQALSDVEFRADVNPVDATSRGNSLYILSDAGNVVTQTFNYKGEHKTDVGRGQFTIWAEDRDGITGTNFSCANLPGNRNSKRGNVYLNNEMKVKRTGTLSTETNVIAANNIRTALYEFNSENIANDTTNIVSQKGDLYLGYAQNIKVYLPGADPSNLNTTTGSIGSGRDVNNNSFSYTVEKPTNKGVLNIKAGFDDAKSEMTKSQGMEGGNIYFTQIYTNMKTGGEYPSNITIPYSSEYICDDQDAHKGESLHNRKDSYQAYEHSGIIGGLGPCGEDGAYPDYAGRLQGANGISPITTLHPSLVYTGNNGDLTVDAGRRGNIILNKGALLDYDNNKGNAIFRTREGDIDMRDPFDAKKMQGGLLFLAQLENLGDLSKIGVCGCDEERNNVYLQDFQYEAQGASGSVFVGADNNIKLNYGGLTNIGTRQDPFLSTKYEEKDGRVLKVGRGYKFGGGCDRFFHCDLDGNENQAVPLRLDFSTATSGGFAAVASDMIDVYKDLLYLGGNGSGMSSVPGTGTLHGESVSGYGLFMKTQGNKKNWTNNVFRDIPKCPTDCAPTGCGGDGKEATGFLHNTVRMTFHSDARFRAENQRVHLESPVIETFGVLELNTLTNGGSNAQITVKTDSLICHDSMVIIGSSKVKLSSWSGLPNDQPIIKLGYSRKAAPFEEWAEENKRCRECVSHYKGKVYAKGETPLDTMFVKFGPTTELRRQNVMVIDHTVLSFLTDSFDHVKGGEVLNARYFVDTLKIRNQVEFWTDKMHERDGHLELISEQQMLSKDYAGMYTRHLHLEPIGACGRPSSELWLPGLALDVITYSTFGGFGTQYTDVHVENQANLNPGFTSLRLRGQCFEQRCGTLTMKDLRLDGGSNLNISVGTKKGLNGEYSDAVDVDMLTTYGPVNVNLEIRPCERIEKRCYPIIYYKSVSPNSLNALKLNPSTIKIDGDEYPLNLNISTDGVVYVCVGDAHAPGLSHTVTMPETSGVKTTPGKGIWSVPARGNFRFSATYSGQKPLVVRTNRMFNGQQEVLAGILNSNGEYEYIVPGIQQEVTLTFGPDAVANELLKGTAVWSHGEMIYIRVDRADIASIYSVAGQLVKRVDLPEGDTSIPMSRGAYVITLKDGSVHKVIVK